MFTCSDYLMYYDVPVDLEALKAINIKNSNYACCIGILADRTVYLIDNPAPIHNNVYIEIRLGVENALRNLEGLGYREGLKNSWTSGTFTGIMFPSHSNSTLLEVGLTRLK